MCLVGTTIADWGLKGAISSLPVISLLAVAGATLFPRLFAQVTEAGGHVAVINMNLFFAVVGAPPIPLHRPTPHHSLALLTPDRPTDRSLAGASGRIERVLSSAPRLFLFSGLQLLGHLGFLLAVGRLLFRLPYPELLLASNANVGGPTTAAAMAGSRRWKSLVLPGILTGIFGYATGTFIGVLLGRTLLCKWAPV
jgi:hypothetical protein